MKKIIKYLPIVFIGLLFVLVGCNNIKSYNNDSSKVEFSENGNLNSLEEEILDFHDIIFESKEFDYDGNPHSLYALNVPNFANVTYSNNDIVSVGNYEIVATIQAPNYNTLRLRATLYINPLEFSDINFEGISLDYDGNAHSIYATNVPEFASVSYTGNDCIQPGKHKVVAKVEAPNYKSLTLTAYLQINALKFEGISFENQDIEFDYEYHSIYATNVPEFASVKYSSNNIQYQKGEYQIKATIEASGYETLVLTATMRIANFMPKAIIEDATFIYNGKNNPIEYTIPSITPYVDGYVEAKYYINDKRVTDSSFVVKEIGTYTVKMILTCEQYNYVASTATATINVVNDIIGDIDKSKQDFKITNDVKYDKLREEILKGNFTVDYIVADEYFYPDGTTKYEEYSTTKIYVSNNEAFKYTSINGEDAITYSLPSTTYVHAKIVNDDVLVATYNNGVFDDNESYKIPASAYSENIIGNYGIICISYLGKDGDGLFIDGQQGGYTTSFGSFKIDEKNNKFILEVRNHYYHSEWDHDEISIYEIYNIGNTKISMIDALSAEHIDYERFENSSYSINGFKYDENTVDIDFDSQDLAYVPKGEYEILPEIDGNIITTITEDYYHKYYDLDLTGYTFKVYFDETGDYQGQYASYGYVSGYKNLYNLEYSGATILYYDDWH